MVQKGTVFWLRSSGTHENIDIVFIIKTYILLPVMPCLSTRGGRGKKVVKWLWQSVQFFRKQSVEKGQVRVCFSHR